LLGAHVGRTIRQAFLRSCAPLGFEPIGIKAQEGEGVLRNEWSNVPRMKRRSEVLADPPPRHNVLASDCHGAEYDKEQNCLSNLKL
jgi:hypothetical protein